MGRQKCKIIWNRLLVNRKPVNDVFYKPVWIGFKKIM